MALVSFAALLFWLLIVPIGAGFVLQRILPLTKRTAGITLLCGYLLSFAIFEVVAIWCMIKIQYGAFGKCSTVYLVIMLVLAFWGYATKTLYIRRELASGKHESLAGKSFMQRLGTIREMAFKGDVKASPEAFISPRTDVRLMKPEYSKEDFIYWGIFAAILAFQLFMAVFKAPFDGDDAYYVVESLLAQQADVMNTIHPYTGISTSLDFRHALAVFTMWIAFIAKMSGIHATIVSHTIMPLIILPLVYLVYLEIGRILLALKRDMLPIYMIFIALFQMFGNTSIYTPETFLMMRTWQGKAMTANFILPLILWIFLWMFDDCRKPGYLWKEETGGGARVVRNSAWILLFLVNMAAGIMSSMGIIFGGGLTGLLSFLFLVYTRDLKIIPKAILSVMPIMVYLLLYMSIWKP